VTFILRVILDELGLPETTPVPATARLRTELELASRRLMSAESDLRNLENWLDTPSIAPCCWFEPDVEIEQIERQLGAHVEAAAARVRRLQRMTAWAIARCP